jgi:hypothetical protein
VNQSAVALVEVAMSDFASMAGIRHRQHGWTLSLIRRFLGEPDTTAPNPRYRSAAPMKLYSMARVTAIEASEDFQKAVEKSSRRVSAALAIAERKRSELIAAMRAIEITVRALPRDKLLRHAIQNYNGRQLDRYDGGEVNSASITSDALFLERIQVNYIRHCLTSYDNVLASNAAKIGVAEANVRRVARQLYVASRHENPRRFGSSCQRRARSGSAHARLPTAARAAARSRSLGSGVVIAPSRSAPSDRSADA